MVIYNFLIYTWLFTGTVDVVFVLVRWTCLNVLEMKAGGGTWLIINISRSGIGGRQVFYFGAFVHFHCASVCLLMCPGCI